MRRLVLLLTIGLSGIACPKRAPVGHREPPKDGTEVTCPVSRQKCRKDGRTPSAVVNGRTYYFCGDSAWTRFVSDPAKYADPL